jgi:hypothetical protein
MEKKRKKKNRKVNKNQKNKGKKTDKERRLKQGFHLRVIGIHNGLRRARNETSGGTLCAAS